MGGREGTGEGQTFIYEAARLKQAREGRGRGMAGASCMRPQWGQDQRASGHWLIVPHCGTAVATGGRRDAACSPSLRGGMRGGRSL